MNVGQLLVGKSVAYGLLRSGATIVSYNDINNLADGSMAIFNGETMHFVDAAADLLDAKDFFVAVGGATNKKTRLSKRIPRTANMFGRAYVASVNETSFLGDDASNTYDVNMPSTLVVGSVATVVVEQKTEINMSQRFKKTYSYTVKTGDTKAIVLTAVIAAINADPDTLVTATGIDVSTANAGIQFVNVNNEKLRIYGQGILIDATRVTKEAYPSSNAVAYTPGVGSYDQVLALEKECMLNEGNSNTIAWNEEMFSYAEQAVSGSTYEQIVFNWSTNVSRPLSSEVGPAQFCTLAIVTGASQLTTIKALLDDIAAVGLAASQSESGVSEENESIVS